MIGVSNLAGDGLAVGRTVSDVAMGVATAGVADGEVEARGGGGFVGGIVGGIVGAAVRRGVGAGVTTGFGVGLGAGFATATFAGLTFVSVAWRRPAPLPLEASNR